MAFMLISFLENETILGNFTHCASSLIYRYDFKAFCRLSYTANKVTRATFLLMSRLKCFVLALFFVIA